MRSNWQIWFSLGLVLVASSAAPAADPPKPAPAPPAAKATASTAEKPAFQPPFPARNPFQLPDGKAVLAQRREAVVQQINLKLKGFVNVSGTRAVVEIDGKLETLAAGDKRGSIEVLEVTPPTLMLQRGPNRWVETLNEVHGKVAVAVP
jgi:hypothetical protein